MDNQNAIVKAAEIYDSFYLYNEKQILSQAKLLKTHFPSVEFLYSLKCNPHPRILAAVFAQGFGADAASAAEAKLALSHGVSKKHIFYSAPGKSRQDIEGTLPFATLIADSLTEIEQIRSAAEALGKPLEIGIRIHPDFSFEGGEAMPSKFGIDEQIALEYLKKVNKDDPVRITGIHVHIKSQELSAEKIARYYQNVFSLAVRAEEAMGYPLNYINFGSGIGIPYNNAEQAISIPQLGAQMEAFIKEYRKTHPKTRILIETGRFLVGKSGVYVTHVADRKISHGKTFLILQNTLNGFLRPSLAMLLEKYMGRKTIHGTEPLFSGFTPSAIKTIPSHRESEVVTLTGNLCTAADVIAEDVLLPRLEAGDLVILTNAGSYGAVLSPMQFSAQNTPVELFLSVDGTLLK